MALLTMLPMVLLLVSHGLADIMVQPGYGQPRSTQQQPSVHPIVQPPATLSHPIVQPPETLSQTGLGNHQESQYVDPGYHLELHPVYTNAYDIPAQALSPLNHQALITPMSRAAYRRLLAANAMPTHHYYQYLPQTVHSRFRRSIMEKRDSTTQTSEDDKHDVASKPSINDSSFSISDSQSRDEKRVSTRQSAPETLLGLNPSSMYPVDQKYRATQLDPISNSNQDQTQSQVTSREATSGQRNAPDPRPTSIASKSSNSASFSESQTVDDKEMVGTRHNTVTNIKITERLPTNPMHSHTHWHGHTHSHGHNHSHGKFKNANTNPEENQSNATPGPNEPIRNNLAEPQVNPQPVYQLAPVQGTNYSPNVRYVIVPQTRPGDYVGNYVLSYPTAPLVSYRICFVTPYDTPSVVYQMV